MKLFKVGVAIVLALLMVTTGMAVAGTLQDVKTKGFVQAGVNGGVFGFSMPDKKGVWKGLDVDTARAIAAAVFGDANKVKFIPLTAVQRLPALQSSMKNSPVSTMSTRPRMVATCCATESSLNSGIA